MRVTGWAVADGAGAWHAFLADAHTTARVPSRCGRAHLPPDSLVSVEPAPRGRACAACLVTVLAPLPPVHQRGPAW